MRKLSRALFLLVILIVGFLLIDVLFRPSPEDEIAQIAVLETAILEPVETVRPQGIAVPIETTSSLRTPSPDATSASVPLAIAAPGPSVTPQARSPRPTSGVNEIKELKDARVLESSSLFDALLTPFVNESQRRRLEFAKVDPDNAHRIDRELNEGRVNFLLFGYGETHEPPATEKALIGSQTILSYDLRTRKITIISLTHDIRAPEIEREFLKQGFKSPAVRIDQAYNVGGFQLMRRVLEDATGLSIDFQVTFKDSVMQGLVDNVFGGVEVDVPMAFDVHPFYLDGKKFDKGHFPRGLQRLDGRQVIQFIKTVPISEGAYDRSLEHNVRKALVFDGLLQAINRQYRDRLFWLRASAFVTGELISGSIAYDFDPVPLIVNNIGVTTASIRRSMSKSSAAGIEMPKIDQTRYIVDPAHGDGGVQWVSANAATNPNTRRDIDSGVYPSLDMEVPITSNAAGDLVTEYWSSVRALVRTALLGSY